MSTDAWLEALEVATAPRIVPPPNVAPYCPGKSGSPNVVQLDGQVGHRASLVPQSVAVLNDVGAVLLWAAQANLTVPFEMTLSLAKLSGVSFLAIRLDAPEGEGVTPTLRLVMPSLPPELPLGLTRAVDEALHVTAWFIGAGRADLEGANQISIAPSSLVWNAAQSTSNYDARRDAVLAFDSTRFLIEAASHEALVQATSVAGGTATIECVATTFFERAAAYGDANVDVAECIANAGAALASTLPVATTCPQASLGTVAPASLCSESPTPMETPPSQLRCGTAADDLAVGLSGMVPADAWVTRHRLVIAPETAGSSWPIRFMAEASVSPVLHAGSVALDACGPEGGIGSSSSAGAHSGSTPGGTDGPIVDHPDDEEGDGSWGNDEVDPGAVVEIVSSYGCDQTATSSSTDACSSDTSTEACSGSDDDGACSSDGGGEACSGGGGDACSGGSSSFGDCSTRGFRRARGPKFSSLLVTTLAVIVPLRRLGRRRIGKWVLTETRYPPMDERSSRRHCPVRWRKFAHGIIQSVARLLR